jgi:hypothetical protein
MLKNGYGDGKRVRHGSGTGLSEDAGGPVNLDPPRRIEKPTRGLLTPAASRLTNVQMFAVSDDRRHPQLVVWKR